MSEESSGVKEQEVFHGLCGCIREMVDAENGYVPESPEKFRKTGEKATKLLGILKGNSAKK